MLKKGIIWRIGNGSQVRIWRDPWLPRDQPRRPITLKRHCRLKWVSELLNLDGTWNIKLLGQQFYQPDIDCILQIKASRKLDSDFLAWHPDKRGCFSVRSAYYLGLQEQMAKQDNGASSGQPDGRRSVWNMIWKNLEI